jgi:glutamate carboxypeptidase
VLPANTLACLVFEADGGSDTDFSLVAARKGRALFRLEVEGRSAHAGSQHQAGVNAIVALSHLVTRLADLTDYARKVTVNIGMVSGGTVVNRVPHEASAELEMRAFDAHIYEQTKRAILSLPDTAALQPPARARVSVLDQTVPWPHNASTEQLISTWSEAAASLGLPLRSEERGGLSDGNLLWDIFPTVDGLGPRGENSQCSEHREDGSKEQEWVDADSFVPKAVLNARAILRLLAE